MISIGWRNLRSDRVRMGVAVCGVVFAVVLVTMEVGMLLGLVQNASLLIDRSRADIWVSALNVKTFDFATPLDQRKRYLIEAVPGVKRVEEYNVSYSSWKLPDGGNANVQVIGFDTRGQLAAPLDLASGSVEALHNQDTVIIDEAERGKLGNPGLGDWVEIMDRRARVAGFTRGMRSFTTTPYVFASLERGERYGYLTSKDANRGRTPAVYFLVKLEEGSDAAAACERIEAQVPGVEAHRRDSFGWRTRMYWLLETGVGIGFLAAALLGVLVGGVIVSQTLYAMTVERLPEFGVLKAMGATMSELARVVLEQGLVCGVAGLLAGLGISVALGVASSSAGTLVLMPWPLVAGVACLTMALCSTAAMVSIARLRRLEPAMVFRA